MRTEITNSNDMAQVVMQAKARVVKVVCHPEDAVKIIMYGVHKTRSCVLSLFTVSNVWHCGEFVKFVRES